MATSNWVDFKTVKAAVSMEVLLERYSNVRLTRSGDELRGRCPIHKGESEDSFHVNVAKNCFQCFVCKARGNVLDFVSKMEQCSVRDAALKLQEWFSVTGEHTNGNGSGVPASAAATQQQGSEHTKKNQPLTFQLNGVDASHPYIADRGISRAIADEFGIGFFAGRGSMSGRVVIPIHNDNGELVAYAGRAIDGSEPKYKVPAGFHKAQVLYNLHRAAGERGNGQVVVVEGFFDCMKVHQAGFACVALMGSSLSAEQEQLLIERFTSAVLLLDGDDAGQRATDECLVRLGRQLWVQAVVLAAGQQPDMLAAEEIHQVLGK
jgi:DNA primase